MTNQQDDVQTLPAVQEQEMRAMQNLFQRAANTIVEASNLGKEVQALKEQLKGLLADTDRMREHIVWLEQENATLRSQRDDAQSTLSNTRNELDQTILNMKHMNDDWTRTASERDNARGEAKLWQEEAQVLEKDRNGLKAEVAYLKGMLTSVWHGIKDHFQEPAQAPKAEPEVLTQVPLSKPEDDHKWHNETEATIRRHESPVAGGYGDINPTF